MLTNIYSNVGAHIYTHVCSQWKVDFDFEIIVYGVYGVAIFLSFLR
jgi:hypothetical protein